MDKPALDQPCCQVAAPAAVQLLTACLRIIWCVRYDLQYVVDSKLVCLAVEIKVFIAIVLLTLFHSCVLSFHYTPKMQVKYKITSSKNLVSSWL